MDVFYSVLIFLVGTALVVKGGDWFVDAASWIAKAAKIPPFIIGATVVSVATTMPEMIVSVMASIDGKNDMAVGNAVGSVTVNTGLVMALSFVFLSVTAPRAKYLKQFVFFIASGVLLLVGSLSGNVAFWACMALILLFAAFTVCNVFDAKKDKKSAEAGSVAIDSKTVAKNIFIFLVGAAGIIVGSRLLINGGSAIAVAIGIPERVIAVTMVAIGTSLPELVTAITAIRKKQAQISVGNIIGANIIDLSLILPVCRFVSGGFAISDQCLRVDMPVCIGIMLIAVIPLVIKQRAYKIQGILMIAAYTAYLIFAM